MKKYNIILNKTTKRGHETLFTYDKNDRLLSTTDPEGYVTLQTYDVVGNINTKAD